MDNQRHSSLREVVDQASEVVSSGHSNDSPADGGRDVLLHDLPEDLTCRTIHDLVKPYGHIVRSRMTYDRDCPCNRCYVVFVTAAEARSALQAMGIVQHRGSSWNVTESDLDYVPNILERAAEKVSPEVRQAPSFRWFVAYYRNGGGRAYPPNWRALGREPTS